MQREKRKEMKGNRPAKHSLKKQHAPLSAFREKGIDSKGETLVECLCAILIIALTSAILMGGIVTSSRLNGMAKNLDAKYQVECNNAEVWDGGEDGTVSISGVTNLVGSPITPVVDVEYNTDNTDAMKAYRLP